jgi:hypothetical protein
MSSARERNTFLSALTEALQETAEQDSKLVIQNISKEEFHSLYLRVEAFTVLEVAWFSDPLQKVIGTVALVSIRS